MRLYSSFFPGQIRLSRKQLVIGAVLLLIIVYLVFFSHRDPAYYTCRFEPVKKKKYEKCLDGYLHGTSNDGGMGNVLFEFLSFIAIAKKTNRRPIISDLKTYSRIENFTHYLPEFASLYKKTRELDGCDCFKQVIHFNQSCCIVDDRSIARIQSHNDSTVRAHTFYTQGIRYLSFLPKSFVSRLLTGSEEVISLARERLFPVDSKRSQKRNFCVHTRRGDFIISPLVFESQHMFTRKAIDYVLSTEGRTMDIYAFGNDRVFLEDVFHNWKNVSLAVEDKGLPPNVEFEFSQLYCDVTLLTASASTYGWWMGYLSRGQVVYYNSDFSRPGGIELQMKREEFFPAHWVSLEMVSMVQRRPPAR